MLNENIENRISLAKIQIIMEKIVPELKKKNLEKIQNKCNEIHKMADMLNNTPYTIHGVDKWNILKTTMMAALLEVREDLLAIKETDVTVLVKALDEVIVS
jgi:hypothetical protein